LFGNQIFSDRFVQINLKNMIKSIGSFLAIIGIAAIIFGFLDRVPTILAWIYNWGDGAAWGIKIGLTVIGAVMWFMGKERVVEEPTSTATVEEEKAE
jgi:hypothetical protein